MASRLELSTQSVSHRIAAILRDPSFGAWQGGNPQSTMEALARSSIDFVQFCVMVEREFGVRFTLGEIGGDDFRSLDGLVALIVQRAAR